MMLALSSLFSNFRIHLLLQFHCSLMKHSFSFRLRCPLSGGPVVGSVQSHLLPFPQTALICLRSKCPMARLESKSSLIVYAIWSTLVLIRVSEEVSVNQSILEHQGNMIMEPRWWFSSTGLRRLHWTGSTNFAMLTTRHCHALKFEMELGQVYSIKNKYSVVLSCH